MVATIVRQLFASAAAPLFVYLLKLAFGIGGGVQRLAQVSRGRRHHHIGKTRCPLVRIGLRILETPVPR